MIDQIYTPPVLTPSAAAAAGESYAGIELQDGQVFSEHLLSNIPQQSAKFFGYPVQCQLMWLTARAIVESGVVTLVDGEATVTTENIAANSVVLLTNNALDGAATPGALAIIDREPGVSFGIVSSEVTDTSDIGYVILNPVA